MSEKTLVSLATYNELENLPALVAEIFDVCPQVEILVVDDNSPDGTGAWADDFARKESRLHVIHRAGKLGLGTAVIDAMKYAIDNHYDLFVNMDADFSHSPEYLPAILAKIHGDKPAEDKPAGEPVPDVVIGSRYVRGGGVEGWPMVRRWMSFGVNTYARCMLGLGPHDTSGSFRCYRVATLEKLDFDAVVSRGYSFFEEILWRIKRVGGRFAEVPILFRDRVRGSSKINRKEAVNALRILFRLGVINWTGLSVDTWFVGCIRLVCIAYTLLLLVLLVSPDPYFLLYGVPDPRTEASKFPTFTHTGVFVVLGTLWELAFGQFLSKWKKTCFVSAALIAAMLMEAVQIFIPSRTFDPIDVAQNVVGMLCGLVIAVLTVKLGHRLGIR